MKNHQQILEAVAMVEEMITAIQATHCRYPYTAAEVRKIAQAMLAPIICAVPPVGIADILGEVASKLEHYSEANPRS